ncbi:MAG: methyltransferase domain-containing protein [Acidobacteria bacterium]|nr:methyltransferase domain-containing protein [Acidobacteriota bacterium]
MTSRFRAAFALVFALGLWEPHPGLAQAQPAGQSAEVQIFEKFRAWVTKQPPAVRGPEALTRYRAVLAGEGLPPAEIERSIRIIENQAQTLEIDRWNRILTAPAPTFNTKPNGFLVEMTKRLRAGKALDVGMGQGRNAIYLAQQGWDVTGFDPAEKAVASAQEQARRLGVKLTALALRDDQFEFGKEQWDLIVLSYVGVRGLLPRLYEALRPGGLVVVEAFHRDATKAASIGGGVVFDTNELLRLFERFRIVHYEDTEDIGDFGQRNTRLVRLCAQKS